MRLVTGLLSALLLAPLAGCTATEGSGDKNYVSGDGRVAVVPAAERGAPVELSGQGIDEKPLSLDDYRGKPTVVVVWWSGCGPCIEEAPEIVAAAAELGTRANFVGINIRDRGLANPMAFVKAYQIPYRSFYAPGGSELLAFDRAIGPTTVPAFVILDAGGRIAGRIVGEIGTSSTLVGVVEDVLEPAEGGDSDG
ncbi:MAG: TlpA family protein disulfide reductase [Nocardioides sp.]